MENFSQSAPVNVAPTGIATFAKCPICPDIRQIQADIAVIGAPCDMAIQGRPGARLGPRGIRTQSTRFRFSPQGSYDPERDDYYLSTEKWSVMDCGDIDYVPGDLEQTFGNIEAAVRLLRSRGCLPVVLGGDHSISIPVARGLDQSGPFHVIQLDAHLDWTDQLGGNRLFNGHPMRYMSQLPYVDRMAHLGIHGIGSSKRSDFQDARAYGATILSARQIRAMGAQKVLEQLPQGGRYYVTIDIDAFDYSIAGGTGSGKSSLLTAFALLSTRSAFSSCSCSALTLFRSNVWAGRIFSEHSHMPIFRTFNVHDANHSGVSVTKLSICRAYNGRAFTHQA